jgi:hypothetical protein
MNVYSRLIILSCSLLVCAFCFSACEKKSTEEGKLIVSESEFILSQFSDNGWSIDAKGKVKNVGEVDVKRVVVTGVCKSCIEVWTPMKWFTYSQNDDIVSSEQKDVVETIGHGEEDDSMFDQKDIISYISVGNEASFSFKEFAYFYTQSPDQKPELPPEEELVISIESFLTAEE